MAWVFGDKDPRKRAGDAKNQPQGDSRGGAEKPPETVRQQEEVSITVITGEGGRIAPVSAGGRRCFEVGVSAASRVDEINDRLSVISDDMKRLQPPSSGSVTLDLFACGKNCMGCPHSRWLMWTDRRTPTENQFFAVRVDDPSRRIKRTGKFEQNYMAVRSLVQEALALSKERDGLIHYFANLSRSMSKRSGGSGKTEIGVETNETNPSNKDA